MKTFLYVALCLAVPPLWGLVSYWLFGLAERRRARGGPEPRGSRDRKPGAEA